MKIRYAAGMLALLIRGNLTGQSAPQIKKTTVQNTSAVSGHEMYMEYCATCHGRDGRGNGPAAAALKKAPSDLTQLSIRNNGTFPVMRITQVIDGSDTMAAHGSKDMPIWGQIFHQMEGGRPGLAKLRIANLADYIKSLQAK